jgi:hypothetical protein
VGVERDQEDRKLKFGSYSIRRKAFQQQSSGEARFGRAEQAQP